MVGLFIQSEEQSVNRRKMQEKVKIWFEVGGESWSFDGKICVYCIVHYMHM